MGLSGPKGPFQPPPEVPRVCGGAASTLGATLGTIEDTAFIFLVQVGPGPRFSVVSVCVCVRVHGQVGEELGR